MSRLTDASRVAPIELRKEHTPRRAPPLFFVCHTNSIPHSQSHDSRDQRTLVAHSIHSIDGIGGCILHGEGTARTHGGRAVTINKILTDHVGQSVWPTGLMLEMVHHPLVFQSVLSIPLLQPVKRYVHTFYFNTFAPRDSWISLLGIA